MTVGDLKKRLNKMPDDKMVIFVEAGGWSNIDIEEKENDVYITCEKNPLFGDN